MRKKVLSISIFVFALWLEAGWCEDKPGKTVIDVYPFLPSGCLKYAVLAEMPAGVVLKSGAYEITENDLQVKMQGYPEEIKKQLQKNAFFLLEQVATDTLLVQLATGHFKGKEVKGKKDRELVNLYFQEAVKEISVTEKEARRFFEENASMMGGAKFEQVKPDLIGFLTQEKRKKVVQELIESIGKKIPVEVSASWTEKQALLARDNPVDRARTSNLPSLVDFGADGCIPCDMMAPILKKLEQKYKGRLNVVFVHVREQQVLAARYGIQSIPVQIFFDREGREVFRHTGFFSEEELEKKIAQLGVR